MLRPRRGAETSACFEDRTPHLFLTLPSWPERHSLLLRRAGCGCAWELGQGCPSTLNETDKEGAICSDPTELSFRAESTEATPLLAKTPEWLASAPRSFGRRQPSPHPVSDTIWRQVL